MIKKSRGRPKGCGQAGKEHALMANRKPPSSSSPAVRDVFNLIDRHKASYARISVETGVSPVSLVRWRHGVAAPKITDIEAVANAMGMRLVLVPLGGEQ